ncbi:MAG: UvrD-helicase domain-containing protein, partial [Clostridia bacterium]|nr:UvrD-helicase domain-containing protein [Clostridia bacterium]
MNETLASRYLCAKRRLFEKVVGEQLNDKQRDAVLSTEGPLLVLAGAGSGKTTVLVRRIAHIIKYGCGYESDFVPKNVTEEQVEALEQALAWPCSEIEENILPEFISNPCPPWAMLAITFTNKAAKEIKERLALAFEDEEVCEQIWAGTFHSVCLRILRKFAKEAGFAETFTIYDTDDKRILLSDIMRALSINEKMLPVKSVAAEISRFKDNLTAPDEVETHNVREADVKRVYVEYQKRLKQYNALDFDDIIFRTVRLLQNCEAARAWCQSKFRYVSVDEYQDTNPAQFRLSELLSGGRRNIMVVGDDDQSIYRFRGATVENILSFDTVYEDCKVIKLEQNYR